MQLKLNKTDLLNVLHDPAEIKRLHASRKNVLQNSQVAPTEKNLADWLGRLKLLHGVPFYYLVPNVAMLPMESIRFFYCNTIWLDYLQEGALSLGQSTSNLKAHDQSFAGDLKDLGLLGARKQRSKVFGHLIHHVHHKLKGQLENTTPIPATEKVSGFLLRSGVVSGWEGLQVEAFYDDEQTKPSLMLRMDHMSPNVLLCMFEGVIKSFRIHEEPEVLHFGVDVSPNPPHELEKSFRYPVDISGHKAGSQTDMAPLKISTYERSSKKGVVRINDLANDMTKKLKEKIGYTDSFTAAEFALEMVEGVEAVNFNIQL